MALSLVAATDKLAQIQGILPQGAFDIVLIENWFFYQRKAQKISNKIIDVFYFYYFKKQFKITKIYQ